MITPQKDKEAIRAILIADDLIARLGFKPDNINTSRIDNSVVTPGRIPSSINISNGRPERSSNYNVKNLVYTITISGNRNFQNKIDDAATQVIGLLNDKDIGNCHILYLIDGVMERETDPAVYSVEMNFVCQSTNFNVVRK